MYKKILVPLDGSELAELVLPYARLLADRFGASLDFIYALETEDLPKDTLDEAVEAANDYLKGVVAAMPEGLETSYGIETGRPADVILERSEQQKASLIAMASHGYSGIQRWFLGSVAHRVVQAAKMPVLLIPAGAKSPEGGPVEFRRVIAPLDGSDMAESLLTYVVTLCKTLDMELLLIRAYNPKFPGSTIRMHEVSQIVHDSAEAYLSEKAAALANEGLKKVSYEVRRGIPAEQITDYALEIPNSLTIMCTHGRHGPSRWILGSVTDAVIHCSQEPVIVYRSCGGASGG